MRYSLSEKKDMYDVYIRAYRNSYTASDNYLQLYPERQQPNVTYFKKLDRHMNRNGALSKKRQKYQVNPTVNDINVLAQVHINPGTSTTVIGRECGLSQRCVSKILRKHGYHDYKFHIVQSLQPNDNYRRLTFCQWFEENVMENPRFQSNILWSDESTFTNNGLFNRRNHHHWAEANPHLIREARHQTRFSVNVWCGLLGNRVVGPYFIDGTLNGQKYLQFLQTHLTEFLDNLPMIQNVNCWYQNDGAPAHNTLPVQEFLNNNFGAQWIGRNGPVAWPPRSPDLNPLDYFFGVP